MLVRVERNAVGDGGVVVIEWQENCPEAAVVEQSRSDFGTRLMDTVIADLRGSIERDFRASGLLCRVDVRESSLAADRQLER